MKIFQFVSFFLLLIKIFSQVNKDNITKEEQNNINNISIQIQKNETDKNDTKKEEKPFNLTESLINFFESTFGKIIKDNNETKNETYNNITNRIETEGQENKVKLEKIQIEKNILEEKIEENEIEKENFLVNLSNNTFEEVIQINLEKGESETLYLDLQSFAKIKIAMMISDPDLDEKINFFFSGPNPRGHTTVINYFYNKKYIFFEYETPRRGEYYAEITNKGTKENEIYFYFSDVFNTEKDVLNTQKIDKISMLLNKINDNLGNLRSKKNIEIKQINSHNEKITNNNKWIVIYSIIEIFTMILVFLFQSYYINSLVNKI